MLRLFLLLTAGALLAGCGSGVAATPSAQTGDGALRVVATTTQVADFARNVGGDRAVVTGLLKPNVDPHDYEASPADVLAISKADVLVLNGVSLENGWLEPALDAAGFDGLRLDTSRGIEIRAGNDRDESAGDPHIWHDPRNARVMVQSIADAFAQADPAHAGTYRANAAAYDARLAALDVDIAAQFATIPAADRKLVTNHDAFGYYVQRYDLTFIGSIIPSFDSSAGLSGSRLNDLVTRIQATGTRAVFSESSLPAATAETIAREAGVVVEAGEDSLYGDTLGPAGSDGATYLEMERHNTRTIVGALRSQ